jgi:uncharacterized membrane protein
MTRPAPLRVRRRWWTPTSIYRSIIIRPRVYLGAACGLAALLLLPPTVAGSLRSSLAWDIGGSVYLLLAFRNMARCKADVIPARAARQDDSGLVILLTILVAIFASFAAIAEIINQAKVANGEAKVLLIGLAAVTIFISWMVTQVVFALHYAHQHYAPEDVTEAAGGLIFPGDNRPDYWDFLYFSTSIGATSQTSDTAIRSKALRRLVTLHAVVSFFFNTTVLALTINLAASLI